MLSYKEVLRIGLAASARGLGIELDDAQERVLGDTMPTWPAFSETSSVLNQLRDDGWQLGILSNVDNDIVDQTLPVLGAPIDLVVTAERVGSYKPDLAHFREFARDALPAEERWVHVACSWTHDVLPARLVGIPSILVNRENEQHDPSFVLGVTSDLLGVPDILNSHLPR
jgi:2-haloacid dehalogenase